MSSFATYLIGYLIFVIGLAVAAYLLHVPAQWIGVGALDSHRAGHFDRCAKH